MYVCICNALTDSDIRKAAADERARRPAEVFAACRCRAQCGTCVRAVCAIIGFCGNAGHADAGQPATVAA